MFEVVASYTPRTVSDAVMLLEVPVITSINAPFSGDVVNVTVEPL